MKKVILIILTLLLIAMIGVAVFFEAIIDYLPIDQSGWKTDDSGARYYLNEKGDPLTGWQEIDGIRYYFDESTGQLSTGSVSIGGDDYSMDDEGIIRTGWVDGIYFHEDGRRAEGVTEIDGTLYNFNEEGVLTSGWVDDRYFTDSGTLASGWLNLENGRYFFNEDGTPFTGWLDMDDTRYYLDASGIMQTGWVDTEEGRFYLNEDGTPHGGWLELDGTFYRLNNDGSLFSGWLKVPYGPFYIREDGTPHLGWLELDGQTYYLSAETGAPVKGKQIIDDKTYYFTSTGANIILVNPWNYIPEDYEVDLVELENGKKVAKVMYDALMQMLADCEAAGHKTFVRSAYRTHADQQANFNRILEKYNYDRTKAAQVVAVPGTSEHQLGLAVDITDNSYRDLDYDQVKTATQQWLMEHCWEYGFILRYPDDKSNITGIIYEPWHYRYVGIELSMELKELGICLEEYIDMLTGDGTTCGGT